MGDQPANRHRGEVAISLAGRDYRLRPTFAAIAEIEARSGQGLVGLARRLAEGDIRVSDFACILCAGLRAAGEPARYEKVGELILEEGVAKLAPAVGEFLRSAIAGGDAPPPR